MVWLLKQGSGIHDLNNGKCDLWSWIKINSACVLSHFSHVWFFVTPWIIVCQAPLSMEFSREEYWSGLPFPPPGESSQLRGWTHISYVFCTGGWVCYHQHHLGSQEPESLALQADSLLSELQGILGKPEVKLKVNNKSLFGMLLLLLSCFELCVKYFL